MNLEQITGKYPPLLTQDSQFIFPSSETNGSRILTFSKENLLTTSSKKLQVVANSQQLVMSFYVIFYLFSWPIRRSIWHPLAHFPLFQTFVHSLLKISRQETGLGLKFKMSFHYYTSHAATFFNSSQSGYLFFKNVFILRGISQAIFQIFKFEIK